MPTTTYTPIASITLSASASEVVFSGLPQTYRDLILVIQGTASSNTNTFLRFNGDATTANYSRVFMLGNGSSTSSGSGSNNDWGVLLTGGSINIYNIMDYSATDKHKTVLIRTGSGSSGDVIAYAGRWANTAAITSISILPSGVTFSSGSTFNLFGVIA